MEAKVRGFLSRAEVQLSQIKFFRQRTDRVWTRDSGPIFVTGGTRQAGQGKRLALVDFKFNAWAKYDNSALDDALPTVVADYLEVRRFVAFGENNGGTEKGPPTGKELQRFVLEGGSIRCSRYSIDLVPAQPLSVALSLSVALLTYVPASPG